MTWRLSWAGVEWDGPARDREVVPREAGRWARWPSDRREVAVRVLLRDWGPGRLLPRSRERDVRGRLHPLILVRTVYFLHSVILMLVFFSFYTQKNLF